MKTSIGKMDMVLFQSGHPMLILSSIILPININIT